MIIYLQSPGRARECHTQEEGRDVSVGRKQKRWARGLRKKEVGKVEELQRMVWQQKVTQNIRGSME